MEIKHQKISTKGQLIIPKEFRDKLKLRAGDEVVLILKEEGILITPKVSQLGMIRGLLKDEIDLNKVKEFIKTERAKWRV